MQHKGNSCMGRVKNIFFICLLCLGSMVAYADDAVAVSDWSNDTENQAYALIHWAREGSVVDRIDRLTSYFVDQQTSYVDGPLGEGVEGDYNQKPLYRFDLFDCTTFVEMVLALAYTRPESIKEDLSAFEEMVKLIRYGNGESSFLTRNHFPSADWIPNNTVGNGLLRDVSHEVSLWGYGAVSLALIDKQGWYQHFDDNNTPICLVDNDQPYPNCDGGIDDQIRALKVCLR